MAIVYSAGVRDARMNVVLAAIDANASPAQLVILTAGAIVLSTITLAKPSFSEGAQTLTLLGVPLSDPSAAVAGTAALARIQDGAGNVVISGLTVGVATGEIQLASTAITVGESVQITSGALVHA